MAASYTSRVFLLAAFLWLSCLPSAFARSSQAFDSTFPTSPLKTRVVGSDELPSGLFSLEDDQTLETATDSNGCAYENASGLRYWPNRDPLGELGGMNLYACCGNDSVNNDDMLGLLPPSAPACQKLLVKINDKISRIAGKEREYATNSERLPEEAPGVDKTPSKSRREQRNELKTLNDSLNRETDLYNKNCNDPEPPKPPIFCPVPVMISLPQASPEVSLLISGAGPAALMPETAPIIIPKLIQGVAH